MRHYRRRNSGSDRVKKIMFRILFVLIAAAVITFGTILLGNYLKYRMAQMDNALDAAEEILQSDAVPEILVPHDYNSPTVFGASIYLTDYTAEDEAILAVNTLAESYDTILLSVTDEDGLLLYQSPSLCAMNRMPTQKEDPGFKLFCSTAAAVKAQNKRLCVLLTPNPSADALEDAAASDGVLISELALYGVDEILIPLPAETSCTAETAASLYNYILTCRTISNNSCPIGILLPAAYYLDTDCAKQIQQIANAASFLAICFPTEDDTSIGQAYRYVADSITSLLGNFNVYNMRVLLDGNIKLVAAKYEACKTAGISNVCFAETILPADLEYRAQTEETEPLRESEQTVPEVNTNPYASSAATESEEKIPDVPEEDSESFSSAPISTDDTPWY